MLSLIDPSKPITLRPTTSSVRANFLAAKTEIEELHALLLTIGESAYPWAAHSKARSPDQVENAVNLTVGWRCITSRAVAIKGGCVWHQGSTDATYRISLWAANDTLLAEADCSATARQTATATFTTAISLPEATEFTIAAWCRSGNSSPNGPENNYGGNFPPSQGGVFPLSGMYASGNTRPRYNGNTYPLNALT